MATSDQQFVQIAGNEFQITHYSFAIDQLPFIQINVNGEKEEEYESHQVHFWKLGAVGVYWNFLHKTHEVCVNGAPTEFFFHDKETANKFASELKNILLHLRARPTPAVVFRGDSFITTSEEKCDDSPSQ